MGEELSGEKFDVKELEVGKKLEIRTQHTTYTLEKREDGLYISGNPKYCSEPTRVYIAGSTAGGRAIKVDKIVVGGYLEFTLPDRQGPITTSEIQEIQEVE